MGCFFTKAFRLDQAIKAGNLDAVKDLVADRDPVDYFDPMTFFSTPPHQLSKQIS